MERGVQCGGCRIARIIIIYNMPVLDAQPGGFFDSSDTVSVDFSIENDTIRNPRIDKHPKIATIVTYVYFLEAFERVKTAKEMRAVLR